MVKIEDPHILAPVLVASVVIGTAALLPAEYLPSASEYGSAAERTATPECYYFCDGFLLLFFGLIGLVFALGFVMAGINRLRATGEDRNVD